MSHASEGTVLAEQAQTPGVRGFQLDLAGMGDAGESVNLFRGDVNLTLRLLTLAGRDGLDVEIAAAYQSNVRMQGATWNVDAPTGLLGLGWSLGFEGVVRDHHGTGGTGDDRYYLVGNGAPTRLIKTGEAEERGEPYWSFEPESYRFWDVRYYPGREEWLIIRESGITFRYGGFAGEAEHGGLQYAVKWGGSNGNWIGSSTETVSQVRFVAGWNLTEIRDTWENRVSYCYESDLVPVGGGELYTRASRLRQIEDSFGRKARFLYGEKRYDDEVREYEIPFVDPHGSSLCAYQFGLETHFLSTIEIYAGDLDGALGQLLLAIDFRYDLASVAESGSSNRSFYKRYLTSVTQRNRFGGSLPGFRFDYYNRPEDREAARHLGALRSVTTPAGGVTTYHYTRVLLEGSERTLAVSGAGIPRVWFGPDYAVVTFYDEPAARLDLRIFTWRGRWVEEPNPREFPYRLDLDSLAVIPQSEFFSLSFRRTDAGPELRGYLFHREKGRLGHWWSDSYRLPLASQEERYQVAMGEAFTVAVTAGGERACRVWDPQSSRWVERDPSLGTGTEFALAAGADYLLVAAYNRAAESCTVSQLRLGADDRQFHRTDLSDTLSPVKTVGDSPAVTLAAGPDFAAATFLSRLDVAQIDYEVRLYQWDANFEARTVDRFTGSVPGDTQLPVLATAALQSMACHLRELRRFDGVRWVSGELADLPTSGAPLAFAYGTDVAVVASTERAEVQVFDPYRREWRRNTPATAFGNDELVPPTLAGPLLTLDRDLYRQDPDGDWVRLGQIGSNVTRHTVQNRGSFVLFEDRSANSHFLSVRNGTISDLDRVFLEGERCWTPETQSGTQLVGGGAFATYRGDSLDQARSVRLHQVTDGTIQGTQDDYVVSAVETNDGYEIRRVKYQYDTGGAVIAPVGDVVMYPAATVVPGYDAPLPATYPPVEQTSFGKSEFRYYNDFPGTPEAFHPSSPDDPPTYYSFLQGLLFDRTDYHADGSVVGRSATTYEVVTSRRPMEAPTTERELAGAYVRAVRQEDAQYLQTISLEGMSGAGIELGALSVDMARALEEAGVRLGADARWHRFSGGTRWGLVPDPKRRLMLPILSRDNCLTVAIPVSLTREAEFSPVTGLATAQIIHNHSSEGKPETLRSTLRYAWEIPEYAAVREAHLWNAVVEAVETNNGAATAIAVTTWRSWEIPGSRLRWASCGTYQAIDPGVYDPITGAVDFDGWNPPQPPNERRWRTASRVTARTTAGDPLETEDGEGHPKCVGMSRQSRLRVSGFVNARQGAAAYAGFEAYEDLARWRLRNGSLTAAVVSGDAHTGTRSLDIVPGQTLETEVTLESGERTWFVSFWAKTPDGWDAAAGWAGWEAAVGDRVVQRVPLAGTRRDWVYGSFTVRLDGERMAGSTTSLTIRARNGKQDGSQHLLLDDLFVTPLPGNGAANVYDPESLALLATVDYTGRTLRVLLDDYQRRVAVCGLDDEIDAVECTYLVREHAGADFPSFPRAAPNSLLSVAAPEGGGVARMCCGPDWWREWTTEMPDGWIARDGLLFHESATPSSITWQRTAGLTDFGVRLSVRPPLDATRQQVAPSHPLGVRISNRLTVRWVPGRGWEVDSGNETIVSVAAPEFTADWMLLAAYDAATNRTAALFYADGRQVFARYLEGPVTGPVTLFAEDREIGFQNVAFFRAPQPAAAYMDGMGRLRQRQSFTGSGIIADAPVIDELGRATIASKPVEFPGTLFEYRADLITGVDPGTGRMTGKVDEYYRPGGGGGTDDQGFPYQRTILERSPLGRQRKIGFPGKEFAILQPEGRPADEHVATFEEGTNASGQFSSDFPAQEYLVSRAVDPDGLVQLALRDKLGRLLATRTEGIESGAPPILTRTLFDWAGRAVKAYLPNAFSGSDPERWAATMEYDFLGQLLVARQVDSGTSEFVYDRGGRLRFWVDADGRSAESPRIGYRRYDALGRTLEEGSLPLGWDRAALQTRADREPGWPGADPSRSWSRQYEYDGDGSDPHLLDRMVRSRTRTVGSAEVVEESFQYDSAGRIVHVRVQHENLPESSKEVSYHLDHSGRVTGVRYPEGSPVPEVRYRYDRLGRLVAAGTPERPDAFALCRYGADAVPSSTSVALGQGARVVRQVRSNSPGWPVEIVDRIDGGAELYRQNLEYTSGGYQGAGYYSGDLAAVTVTRGSGTAPLIYRYRHDGLGRVLVAQNPASPEGSLGTLVPTEYDANGNFQRFSRGSRTRVHHYPSGNRLQSVDEEGITAARFTFQPTGDVLTAEREKKLRFTYDPVLDRTARIDTENSPSGATSLAYRYNGTGQRAIQDVQAAVGSAATSSTRLYVHGTHDRPLFEEFRSGGTAEATQYLMLPAGISLALTAAGGAMLLADHLGSLRTAVDGNGRVLAQLDYLLFGESIGAAPAPEDEWLRYRYTGQEYDAETGLYHYGARLYDPWLGRFYAIDPEGQFSSPYLYAGDDAADLNDPSGAIAPLLLAILIGLAAGAVAGGVTYGVENGASWGMFAEAKFWGYVGIGAAAGAVAGAVGYGVGTALAAVLPVAAGGSAWTGAVVGLVSGAADGAVGGTLTQLGANWLEGRPADEGLGEAAGIGAGFGAASGMIAGGITGRVHTRTQVARDLAESRGREIVNICHDRVNPRGYSSLANAVSYEGIYRPGASSSMSRYEGLTDFAQLQDAVHLAQTNNRRLAIVSHGDPDRAIVAGVERSGSDLARELHRAGCTSAVELVMCNVGRGRFAQDVATGLGQAVRAPTGAGRLTYGVYKILGFGRHAAFYPNSWTSAWVRLFGY